MNSELQSLQKRYPLPDGWELKEVFVDQAAIGGGTLHLVGLCATNRLQPELSVSASAVDEGNPAYLRAWFELVERTALIGSGGLPASQAYGEGSLRNYWRFAASNGVAAHTCPQRARLSARRELIERDRVLRAWWGEITPTKAALPKQSAGSLLHSICDLRAYVLNFNDARDCGVHVGAIIGIPRDPSRPIALGFGAAEALEPALAHAFSEALQRIGFLWDEPCPEQPVAPTPSPEFHLDYFRQAGATSILLDWLENGHKSECAIPPSPAGLDDIEFDDLTPGDLKGQVWVVRARSNQRIPLTFGGFNPSIDLSPNSRLLVHPIA